jgi:NAD(P)-dependent dehydrogenase (short-subunit alcohol dehydrogenase family)
MRLENQTAVITGAGGDLGRAMALRLAGEGAGILVNDLNLAAAQETVDLIEQAGGRAQAHQADVTAADQVSEMIGVVEKDWGGLDILVNNAGDIRDALLVKMTDQDWDFVINLNLKGAFVCARAAAPPMIARQAGRIVNITSMAYKGNIGQSNYVSAKAGVVGLTHALGLELARYGITVNCVAPGLINTPKAATLDQKVRDRLVAMTPMRRMGEMVDIANAVLFLASDEAAYISRQVIHVAGGMEGF